MRTDDELLDELRTAYAGIPGAVRPDLRVEQARSRGRAVRRRRSLLAVAPVAVGLVGLSLRVGSGLGGRAARPATLGAEPSATVPAPGPDLGTIDGFTATYLPDTTVQPVGRTSLAFERGSCTEAYSQGELTGCWTPPECTPSSNAAQSPCNVGLILQIRQDGPIVTPPPGDHPYGRVRQVVIGGVQASEEVAGDGFFTFLFWSLPNGDFADLRGSGLAESQVLRFADSLRYDPARVSDSIPSAEVQSPTASPTPPPPTTDARPSAPPPPVRDETLLQSGSAHAITGDGWALDISQGSGRGAVGVGVDAKGGIGGSSFVYSEVYGDGGKATPIPIPGLAGVSVTQLANGRQVVSGGVARGSSGVAVEDAAGVKGWATVIDPGPAFDTWYFAYEGPTTSPITAVQSFGGNGERTGNRTPPSPGAAPPSP